MAQTRTLEQPVARPTASRHKRLRQWLLWSGPLIVAVAALALWLHGGRFVTTDNAYLRNEMVTVAPRLSGTVEQVLVRDNQRVREGEVLFRLDEEPYRIALASARATLSQAEVDLKALQATYRQRQADIAQAESDVQFFEREFERQRALTGRGVAAVAALDEARRNMEGARSHVNSLKQEAQSVLAQLGGDGGRPIEEHPRWLAAKAAVDKAEYDLRQTVVRASMDGIVANVEQLQPGEVLQAGSAAFSLVGAKPWVEANPKETELTYVAPGDPATVTVDAYPGRTWHATVASVSPATGAEFAVLPPQNASGNWVKVVQRVPVRLGLDIPDGSPQLSAGMSVEVSIDTGHRRSLSDLFD